MAPTSDFERLINEAEAQPFVGWDFSWLGKRIVTQPFPWDYDGLVAKRARESPDLLDMDTGGGEWLARLPYRPDHTVATESYPPNVPVAARRLRPLGVSVVRTKGAPDNNVQRVSETRGPLPFQTGSLLLVVNRHSSFVATEVSRALAENGRFITQQVGDQRYADFHRLLKLPAPPLPLRWNLSAAKTQVKAAQLRVIGSGEAKRVISFSDVGAFAWYLKAIPWTVENFSVQAFRGKLEGLNSQIQRSGPVQVRQSGFWLEAAKQIIATG